MRKYISQILVFIFLFDIGGYYLFFCITQYKTQKAIRLEIRKGIKEEDMTLIVIPQNGESDICWIKKNKEFRYNSEMYDILKTKTEAGKRYFYCIKDVKEKELISWFLKSSNNKNNAKKKNIPAFKIQYFPDWVSDFTGSFTTDRTFITFVNLYKSADTDIHSPPPKQAHILI